MTYAWGNLWRLPFTAPTASVLRRSGILTVLLYGVLVVVFAALAIAVEVGLGHPLINAAAPGFSHSLLDAFWHLATALVLAIPARRYVTLWLAPVLALGLDVDHVFGDLLPTVTGRTAHDLLFVLALTVVLGYVQGRSAALVAAGAVLAHLGVDGGMFPLLGPVTVTFYALPLGALLVLMVAASTLFFLAGRELRELLRPIPLLSIAVACTVVGAVFVYLPEISGFIGQ